MKRDAIKSSHLFRDQVNMVTAWFKSWNECEQTVALFSLLKKVSATQARFLLAVLQQGAADLAPDVALLEHQANNPACIAALTSEPKAAVVSWLLSHMPLLRPGNPEAKAEYLTLLPKLLQHSIEHNVHIEESRQLLSYSLIHPAVSADERALFTAWLAHLEHQYQERQSCVEEPVTPPTNGWHGEAPPHHMPRPITAQHNGVSPHGEPPPAHMPLCVTASGPPAFYSNTQPHTLHMAYGKPARSSSMTPPVSVAHGVCGAHVSEWLNAHHDHMAGGPHIITSRHSMELHDTGQPPLSPQSSMSSSGSGSETQPDDANLRNTFLEPNSGMKDVPMWLKSLRLHKYASLFQQLEYNEMLQLTESWLETQKVTKGARHKIVLSINKLRERQNILRSMEKEILECVNLNLKPALTQIKAMISTPIKGWTPPASALGDPEEPTANGGEKPESASTSSSESPPASGATTAPHLSPLSVPPNLATAPPPAAPPTSATQLPPAQQEGDIVEGDLPGQLCRVMGKACTQLLVSARMEDDCFPLYLQLLDKCMVHEAFTEKQKNLMCQWKAQVQKVWHPPLPKYSMDKQRRAMYQLGLGHTFPLGLGALAAAGGRRPVRGAGPLTGLSIPAPPHWTFSKHPPLVPPPPPHASIALIRQSSLSHAYPTRPPPMYEPQQMKAAVTRTHSAPLKSAGLGALPLPAGCNGGRQIGERPATEPEINARLDSLCLSMTEHALADSGERGPVF